MLQWQLPNNVSSNVITTSSHFCERVHLNLFFTYALRAVACLGATAEGAKAATEVARMAPMARVNFILTS
jgi:hypothetical protein